MLLAFWDITGKDGQAVVAIKRCYESVLLINQKPTSTYKHTENENMRPLKVIWCRIFKAKHKVMPLYELNVEK